MRFRTISVVFMPFLLLVMVFSAPAHGASYDYHAGHVQIESYDCHEFVNTHMHNGGEVDVPSTGTHQLTLWVPYYLHAPHWVDEAWVRLRVGGGWDSAYTTGGPIDGNIGMQTLVSEGDTVWFFIDYWYKDGGFQKCGSTLAGYVEAV